MQMINLADHLSDEKFDTSVVFQGGNGKTLAETALENLLGFRGQTGRNLHDTDNVPCLQWASTLVRTALRHSHIRARAKPNLT